MLKIRRPLGRLIFNMGIAIPGKTVFLIETAPRFLLKDALFGYCLGAFKKKQKNTRASLYHLSVQLSGQRILCTDEF